MFGQRLEADIVSETLGYDAILSITYGHHLSIHYQSCRSERLRCIKRDFK